MIPARKVTEDATNTLCSSLVRPSKPVMLWGRPSSGTNLVTTEPIIRHKTGNGPSKREKEYMSRVLAFREHLWRRYPPPTHTRIAALPTEMCRDVPRKK